MAVDKLVDSTQLDADLTSVADAIRTKGGTSAQLAFPDGFVDAIEAIDGSIGDVIEEFYTAETIVSPYSFAVPQSFMVNARARVVNLLNGVIDAWYGSQNAFNNMPNLEILVLPKATRPSDSLCGSSVPKLKVVDFPNVSNRFETKVCNGAPALETIILRRNAVCTLAGTNVFSASNGRFASGGTGGKIYIPKTLYDHLGDESAQDYLAATNWAAINSRATITWLPIEGSEYDGVYADGTPIT